MTVDPSMMPSTGAEIDPSRRPGLAQPKRTLADAVGARGSMRPGQTLNPMNYSGSTAMKTPTLIGGQQPGPQAVASGDKVWWGYDEKTKTSKLIDKSMANNAWMMFPDETRQQMGKMMDSVFGEGKWKNSQLQHYWVQAVSGANYALYANNQYIHPLDVLPTVLGEAMRERQATAGGGGGGGSRVSTTTQIRLSDPQTAGALLDQALSQALGRAATRKEQRKFMKALNRLEARNATVTRSVAGAGGTSVVTTGGFNPSTFAEEYARGMEGSAEFQAATTYLDAFMGALKPVVS